MTVKVKQHKGKWWVFIDHKGKRKAKRVGSKQAAETAAKKIEARLTLGDFSLLDEKPQRPFDGYFRNWIPTSRRTVRSGPTISTRTSFVFTYSRTSDRKTLRQLPGRR